MPQDALTTPEVTGPAPSSRPADPPLPPSDRPEASILGVLRHKHFRVMWIAAFGSYVGNWFEFVAIGWLLAQETKSEDWMAFRAAAQLCPTLVLGMWAGLIADSVNRRTLLIVTQVAMMVIALAMAAAAWFDLANRWVLVSLALAQGIAIAFNMPAWQVLTPRLVPRSELTAAITLSGISFNAARVVGPAIAGAIMRAFQNAPPATLAAGTAAVILTAEGAIPSQGSAHGAGVLLLFNALTFIGVMAAVFTTPDAPAPPDMRGAWRRPIVIWTRSKEAIRWVWSNKGARAVFWAIVFFALLATPVLQLLPLMVSEVYHAREDSYGLLLAMMGLGAVAAGLAMKHVPRWYPMHHFIPLSITLGGLTILLFTLAPSLPWAMFAMPFVGIFWMWGFNSTGAAMQHLVSDEMRGRVSAVTNTIAMGLMPLGTVIASQAGRAAESTLHNINPKWVDSGTRPQLGLAATSLILIAAGLFMLIWRTPEIDGLKPGDPKYDRKPGLWRGITANAHRRRSR